MAVRLRSILQTSMFVPDPVISLSIKPTGTETPNFSRALNRFQKEDPTFRVHIDSESQEVLGRTLSSLQRTQLMIFILIYRQLSPAWVNCILISMLSE